MRQHWQGSEATQPSTQTLSINSSQPEEELPQQLAGGACMGELSLRACGGSASPASSSVDLQTQAAAVAVASEPTQVSDVVDKTSSDLHHPIHAESKVGDTSTHGIHCQAAREAACQKTHNCPVCSPCWRQVKADCMGGLH